MEHRIPGLDGSGLVLVRGWQKRYGRFAGKQQEGERFLQVEANGGIGVAQIPDGEILADVEFEVAASRGHHECSVDGRCPDNFVLDEALHVLQHRVAVIAGFSQGGVSLRAKENGIRTGPFTPTRRSWLNP